MIGNLREQSDREDRGVSEVVAFVLVFAVVLISIGLLSVTAFQSMHSYQEGEQVKSAAQGMEALTSNFNDVLRQGGTDQRSGELALRDGTIRLEEGTTITVTIDGTEDEVPDPGETGSLIYQYGSSTIGYEAGGLFQGIEDESSQSVVTSQPALTCSESENGGERRAVISLLDLESDRQSVQASGIHRFTLVQDNVKSKTFSDVDGVSVEVKNSQYANGWENAFDQDDQRWDGSGDNAVTGTCDASTVVVRIVEATVIL